MVNCDVLHVHHVKAAGHSARIQCSPADAIDFLVRSHVAFPMFLDYQLDGERLLNAVRKVAEKYLCVCGRLVPDPQTRFAIEVPTIVSRLKFTRQRMHRSTMIQV